MNKVVDFEPDGKAFAARVGKLVAAEIQTGKRRARLEGTTDLPCVVSSDGITYKSKQTYIYP